MKILIADPLAKVRNALSLLLQKNPSWIVSGRAKNPNELISKITIFKPDVLLLDWYLLGEYPTDVIQSVRQLSLTASPRARPYSKSCEMRGILSQNKRGCPLLQASPWCMVWSSGDREDCPRSGFGSMGRCSFSLNWSAPPM